MHPLTRRRQEEKERRRNDILDAAERVAAEGGLESLSMDQVAREARLSRGLLYVYFRDKHDLESGICERALRDLYTRFEKLSPAKQNGLDHVVALGRAYVAFAAECPLQFEALVRFEATDATTMGTESNDYACLAAGGRHATRVLHAQGRGRLVLGGRDPARRRGRQERDIAVCRATGAG